jgi:hypothetical protein
MGLSDNPISVDPDGVTDAPRNSVLAAIAGLLGILGLFAIVAPVFSFVCLASVLCGLVVLVFARRWDLSPFSIRIASLAVFAGLFSGLAGFGYQATRDTIFNRKAVEVATNYMLALAKGDRATAIKMAGLPQLVEDSELDGQKTSREQKAVRNFLADPAIQEIIKLGEQASWKTTGIQARYRSGIVFEYSIGFIDANSTNPRPYIVVVKMMPPSKHTVETRNQWYVESINQAPL